MRNQTARRSWLSTTSAFVLLTLAGCASAPQVVVRYETVKVPVLVVQKIDPELLKPCIARFRYRPDGMPIRDMRERLAAVEDALAICWNQIENIAAGQREAPAK